MLSGPFNSIPLLSSIRDGQKTVFSASFSARTLSLQVRLAVFMPRLLSRTCRYRELVAIQ